MSDKRYAVMFLRFGFLASVLFALFWGVWHIFGHQVPVYTSLKITENMSLTFPISRWWDVPFAFLFVNIYAWIWRVYYKFGSKFAEKEDLGVSLGAALGVSLGVSLGAGLGVALVAGLVAGLGVGLVAGLVAGLGVGLVAGLGVCVTFLVKDLFSSNFWKMVFNWFTAKNIA